MHEILIVDDERDICDLIAGILEDEGYKAHKAYSAEEALAHLARDLPSLLLLDVWLTGSEQGWLDILATVKEAEPYLPVIVISGHGNIEIAVRAMRAGAYDFIEKPLKINHLLLIIERALEHARLRKEVHELSVKAGFCDHLVGESNFCRQMRRFVKKVAPMQSRVLLTGPPGSGKETLARLLHTNSTRAEAPFIAVNLAALPKEQLDGVLFGYQSSANGARRGLIQSAHRGTLFIEEVVFLPKDVQNKLRQLLIEGRFYKIGATEPTTVEVRIISASSQNIQEEINKDAFDEDLFHRLNVIAFAILPLSRRIEDIVPLVRYFTTMFAQNAGIAKCVMNEEAMTALKAYHWPGNIRQLRNVVEQSLIMNRGEKTNEITAHMLPDEIRRDNLHILQNQASQSLIAMPLREAREHFEREYLIAQTTRFDGNISKTAAFIGIERSTLYRKLKQLCLLGSIHPVDSE